MGGALCGARADTARGEGSCGVRTDATRSGGSCASCEGECGIIINIIVYVVMMAGGDSYVGISTIPTTNN